MRNCHGHLPERRAIAAARGHEEEQEAHEEAREEPTTVTHRTAKGMHTTRNPTVCPVGFGLPSGSWYYLQPR